MASDVDSSAIATANFGCWLTTLEIEYVEKHASAALSRSVRLDGVTEWRRGLEADDTEPRELTGGTLRNDAIYIKSSV
jgi:hypothetical protein